MDHVVTSALQVLHTCELSDPRRFFEAVDEVLTELDQEGHAGDLREFTTRFTERAGRDGFTQAGEEFVKHLESTDGADVLRKFAEVTTDELVAEHDSLRVEQAVAPVEDTYDEAAWNGFVAEFGPGWNGDPANWDAFRTWFLHYANERRLASPAADFLDYAEGEPDRVAFFARYGVVIADTSAAGDEGNVEAWQAFLAEYGPAWQGQEDTWAEFPPYFLHFAAERGVLDHAQAFVDNAPEDNAARIQYFVSYGIAIAQAPEVDAAAAQVEFQDAVIAASHIPPDLEGTLNDAYEQLVAEVPEAAGLSKEQILELLTSDEVRDALDTIETGTA